MRVKLRTKIICRFKLWIVREHTQWEKWIQKSKATITFMYWHKEPIRNSRSSVLRNNLEEVTSWKKLPSNKKSLSQDPRMQKEKRLTWIWSFSLRNEVISSTLQILEIQRHLCKLAEGYNHNLPFKIYNDKVKLGSANQNIYIYICLFIPSKLIISTKRS